MFACPRPQVSGPRLTRWRPGPTPMSVGLMWLLSDRDQPLHHTSLDNTETLESTENGPLLNPAFNVADGMTRNSDGYSRKASPMDEIGDWVHICTSLRA